MIIFINGTIGSGKTTIAKQLQKKIPNTAVIEPDILRNFIQWMPLEKSIPLNLENTISLIKNFVNKKLNVIIPYPLSRKNYDYLIDKLNILDVKIFVVTLNPQTETLTKGQRGRDLNAWEKDRINYHTKIGLTNPTFGKTIDNTNQTPDKTTEEILKLLEGKE